MSTPVILPPAADILAAIAESPQKEDYGFYSIFDKRHVKNPSQGWDQLVPLFGFHFRASNATEPFGPMSQFDGMRSMIPSDLNEEQLSVLGATVGTVNDPEFQARILDVIWLLRRDATAARAAVEAYVESGIRLEDPENWVASIARYERALRLARQVDSRGPLPGKILAHLESRVLYYDGSDPLFFTLKALQLIAEHRYGDAPKLAEIAGRVAARARAAGDFDRARSHYGVQARLHKNANNSEGAEAAKVASAECFAEEGEQREEGGSALAAHHFWQEAMNAFRERPSLRARLPEIQRRLAAAGEASLGEMTTHSFEMDLSKPAEIAQKAVAGLPFEDALFTFTRVCPLIDPAALREEAVKDIAQSALRYTIAAEILDASGRKVGTRPAASTTDPEKQEAAIVGAMEFLARFHRTPSLMGAIAPAMRQLLQDHDIDEAVLEAAIGDSLLIPEDRKSLFLRGLMAGFRWDFPTALHLLIPQVENGLRKMLHDQGVVPRIMSPEGVEEVWSYERVLAHELTRKTLGEPLVYELQSLLVARLGVNMRNLIAHGLASENVLGSETGFYLWWILLRLIALPTPKMAAFIERKRQ